MKLFRAPHNDHTTVCQTKQKPLRHFLLFADSLTQSKSIIIFGGITITTPSHLKISYHTTWATLQKRNKWFADYIGYWMNLKSSLLLIILESESRALMEWIYCLTKLIVRGFFFLLDLLWVTISLKISDRLP
jgi:hypothetical protein